MYLFSKSNTRMITMFVIIFAATLYPVSGAIFYPSFSGYEECMVPVSKSLARVLASGHLSPEFLISKALPSILGFLWPGCGSWPEDKQQLHVLVLSGLVEGLRSLLLFHMQ